MLKVYASKNIKGWHLLLVMFAFVLLAGFALLLFLILVPVILIAGFLVFLYLYMKFRKAMHR